MGMWDGAMNSTSRKLIVVAERCSGKTSFIADAVLDRPVDAVVISASEGDKTKIDRRLYVRGIGERNVHVIVPQAYRNVQMTGVYDVYVDEPWHVKGLESIIEYFNDARCIILVGTPDDDDCDNEATRIWWNGIQWSNINYLTNKDSIPRYTGSMTVADRVIAEMHKLSKSIDNLKFGTVTVSIQDGRVVLTEITSKHKPA